MQKDYNHTQTFEKEGLGNIFGIRLNALAEQHLRSISNWTIIGSTVGFAVLCVSLLGMYKSFRLVFAHGSQTEIIFVLLGSGIYVVLNILLNVFLLRIGISLKKTLISRSQVQLGNGLSALRNYMRGLGAYLIIFVFILLLVFVITFMAIWR